jgi:hypothetical protein
LRVGDVRFVIGVSVRQSENGAQSDYAHTTNQDVAVLDVRDLVGQDATKFAFIQQRHQPPGHRHHAVCRIPAGGEGVGLVLGDYEDPRFGDLGSGGQLLHHGVQARGLNGIHLGSVVHAQDQSIGEEIRADVHEDGQAREEGEHAWRDQRTQSYQQRRKGSKEEDGLELVLEHGGYLS